MQCRQLASHQSGSYKVFSTIHLFLVRHDVKTLFSSPCQIFTVIGILEDDQR